MNWAASRSDRLASVKPNHMVRSSGQPATSASTTSMGAMKSQAERIRSRVSLEAFCGTSAAVPGAVITVLMTCSLIGYALFEEPRRSPLVGTGAGGAWPPAPVDRYQRPPRESRSRLLSSAASRSAAPSLPLKTSCAALKNSELTWLYLAPVTREGRATAWVKVS